MTWFDELEYYIGSGGFVMGPLLIGTAILWFGIGWRALTLKRGVRLPLRDLVAQVEAGSLRESKGIIDSAAVRGVALGTLKLHCLREYLDDCFGELQSEMRGFQGIVRSIVMVAPLAGLLGTVAGMIETFDSLGSMSLFSQSGGVAGGISQALISTQMGLAVAIPGLLAGRILQRRQTRLEMELEQLKELLCTRFGEEK